MARVHQATETLSLEQTLEGYPGAESWVKAILLRIGPHMAHPGSWRVLDVGAAQGRSLVALARMGHEAHGVEPSVEALTVAGAFAEHTGVTVDIREGTAESIPFPDGYFDLVIATSVIEHVGNLSQAFDEVSRVLKPGGLFWFSASNALCPSSQNEIRRFPGFGWYPDPLKRRIMYWARDNRPELVGYTQWPAINWFTPWKARRTLEAAGFDHILDRWDIRVAGEDPGIRGRFVALARRYRALRLLGEVVTPGSSYLARRVLTGKNPPA